MEDRRENRRSTDQELVKQRELERHMRTFIGHFDDDPRDRTARVDRMIEQVRPVLGYLDTIRAEGLRRAQAAGFKGDEE